MLHVTLMIFSALLSVSFSLDSRADNIESFLRNHGRFEGAVYAMSNDFNRNTVATTDGWIDLWISDNGKYVYQLFGLSGTIGVFKVDEEGRGNGLTEIQRVIDLPQINTQGIVAF